MSALKKTVGFSIFFLLIAGIVSFSIKIRQDDKILSYTADLKKQDIGFYWKDDNGEILKSIQNLKSYLERKNRTLVFASNGGMYKKDNTPQGLFIQNQKELFSLDTKAGSGNFYLQPNGVFYVTNDKSAGISTTANFKNKNVNYATQSGPMLVIDGEINPAFKDGSANVNIRNGVGVLADGKVVFAMSKSEINFYDFAEYFKSLGCKNALYLDGFVSRTYLPEKNWVQTDGNFGVMIGISKKRN